MTELAATELARTAAIITSIELMVAGGIGFAFYKLIVPPGPSKTASELGRKWFAWSLCLAAFSTVLIMAKKPSGLLGPMEFLAQGFGQLIANLFLYGAFAFLIGWLYGRFVKFKSPIPETDNQAILQAEAWAMNLRIRVIWMIMLTMFFAALLLFVGVGNHFMSNRLAKSDATNSLAPDVLDTIDPVTGAQRVPNVFDNIDPQTGEYIVDPKTGKKKQ